MNICNIVLYLYTLILNRWFDSVGFEKPPRQNLRLTVDLPSTLISNPFWPFIDHWPWVIAIEPCHYQYRSCRCHLVIVDRRCRIEHSHTMHKGVTVDQAWTTIDSSLHVSVSLLHVNAEVTTQSFNGLQGDCVGDNAWLVQITSTIDDVVKRRASVATTQRYVFNQWENENQRS